MENDRPPRPDEYIPIPDEHYAAVGRVADTWADLEFEIDTLIWDLLQTPQAFGACVTGQMISVHPRLQALRSLAALWEISKALDDKLAELDGEISALAEKRNRTIHDKRLVRWKTKDVVRFQISARRKLKFGPEPESIADLDKFRDVIRKLTERFVLVARDIRTELASSAEKQRSPLPHITRWTGQLEDRDTDDKSPDHQPEPSQE
jgi:hypothetical protein